MYRIIGYNGPRTKNQNVIYDIHENKYVDEAKLTLKDSMQIDDLEITVNKKNWLFTHNHPFKTHVEVYDDNKLIFRGRLLKPTKEMKSDGMFSHTYTFESIKAYLLDSAQRFYINSNMTATELLKHILKWHNKDVSVSHQVEIKDNDFAKSKTTHYVKIEPTTTWDALNNILIKKFGGKLDFYFDAEKHKNYLNYIDPTKEDYVKSITHTSPVLEIGTNLKSISFVSDPSNVITRLVPLGAEIKPKKIKLGDDTTTEEVDGKVYVTGATHKVHGSWASAVRHAARIMGVKLSSSDLQAVLALIKHESGGNERAVNPKPVLVNGHYEHAHGLVQFVPTTFNYYKVKGFSNINKGFDSLLAAFNAPSFLSDARNWLKTGNWSPKGEPIHPNGLPKEKYITKKHLKSLNKWGWPFPSAGKGSFLDGQLFGNHPSAASYRNGHSFHDGLDFGTVDHKGTYVHAIHGGTVILVGQYGGIGWVVVIKSSDGYQVVYQEAFASRSSISVKVGDTVKTGQKIGVRDSSLQHLHIGVVKKPYTWWQGYNGGHSYEKWHWKDPLKLIEHGGEKGDKASSAKYYTPKKTGERINIKSVNNGKDYLLAGKPTLKTDIMLDTFGYIAKNKVFDTAKTPEQLLKKAKAWLKQQETDYNKESYKISALELPRSDFKKFQVGHLYPTQTFGRVLSENKNLKIVQKEIDIPNSPYNSSLEIGERVTGIADYQVETNNTFKTKLESLEHSMIGLSQTVTTVQSDADDLEDTVDSNRTHADAAVSSAKGKAFFLSKDFKKYKKEVKKQKAKDKKEYEDFKKTVATKEDLNNLKTELMKAIDNLKGGNK